MTTAGILIERNVPIPPAHAGYKWKGGGRPPKYPWRYLKMGESFLVWCTPAQVIPVMNALTNARSFAEKQTGFKFTMRRVESGIRIWRVVNL